jgi:hypothetical protein
MQNLSRFRTSSAVFLDISRFVFHRFGFGFLGFGVSFCIVFVCSILLETVENARVVFHDLFGSSVCFFGNILRDEGMKRQYPFFEVFHFEFRI